MMGMKIIVAFVILTIFFILLFVVRHLCSELKILKLKNSTLERQKDAFAAELARYKDAQEVMGENRRDADAKVDALHSGDAVGNAIDELRKR